MAKFEEFQAELKKIDDETTRLATLLEGLLTTIANGGLSEEQENMLLGEARTYIQRLKTIGADPNNPVPPPPGPAPIPGPQ